MRRRAIASDVIVSLPRLGPTECPYLPDESAVQRGFMIDRMPPPIYEAMINEGWRRSGKLFFLNDCPDCSACIPLRVDVNTFRPTRSQRRALRRNADVSFDWGPPEPTEAKQAVYERYVQERHIGLMTGSEEEFDRFLYDSPTATIETTLHIGERFVGAGIVDVLPDGLSSVYFYFDPDEGIRSLGVYSALKEIELCAHLKKRYYHLGHWVAGARTMSYKSRFGPYELLGMDLRWRSPEDPYAPKSGPMAPRLLGDRDEPAEGDDEAGAAVDDAPYDAGHGDRSDHLE
jgi:arginyl-tRNA--protein-N-Asp/Glu arginylyltransferase